MNNKTKQPQTHFVLLVDQDRDMFFNHVLQLAVTNPDYAARIKRNKMEDAAKVFFKDMGEGELKVDWCNARGCKGGDCEHKKELKEATESDDFETIDEYPELKKSTKKYYTLEMDEDRDRILNVIETLASKNPGLIDYLIIKKLDKSYKGLLEEWNIKTHEAGFCKDPDCTYGK